MGTQIKYFKKLTQKEAIEKAKEIGGEILLNKEIDALLNKDYSSELYCLNTSLFPVWCGDRYTYDKEGNGTIEINGENDKVKFPIRDGWYEQDKYGFPTGKESNVTNKNARYLWRRNEAHTGLVARSYGDFGGTRDVGCYYYAEFRCGVLIRVKIAKEE